MIPPKADDAVSARTRESEPFSVIPAERSESRDP